MTKLWWCWAVAGLSALACTPEPADDSSNDGKLLPSAGKSGAPDANDPSPARVGRGSVTLLGSNLEIRGGTWSFSGPPEAAGEGEDTVGCSLSTTTDRAVLDVSASVAGADAPAAAFVLEMQEASPTPAAVTNDELGLDVDVAFTPTGSRASYRYTKGSDTSTVPAVSSSCSVVVTELSERWASGQVICRNLLATPTSLDATQPDGSRGRASATIAFDCPIRVDSAPRPGGLGGSSAGGSSSSGGGSSQGGSSSSGGSSGGSSASLPESCHGVASTCSLQGASCASVKGCTPSSTCEGIARSCYAYFEASGCYGQQGCYWSSVSKNCQGLSWSCDLFDGSATCVSQYGCDWQDDCEGVPTPCSQLGEFTCSSQPGCSWY